jgi:hypothetical protein
MSIESTQFLTRQEAEDRIFVKIGEISSNMSELSNEMLEDLLYDLTRDCDFPRGTDMLENYLIKEKS